MAGTMTQGQDRPERQDVGARLTRGARDYWMVLRRHRVILFVTMALCLLAALLYILLSTPDYRATASVEVEDVPAGAAGAGTPPRPSNDDVETAMQTQLEVLRSRALAEEVARSLALVGTPTFFEGMGVSRPKQGSGGQSQRQVEQERVIALLRDRLEVELPGKSRVIRISFVSADPALSARIANGYADSLIRSDLKRGFQSGVQARRPARPAGSGAPARPIQSGSDRGAEAVGGRTSRQSRNAARSAGQWRDAEPDDEPRRSAGRHCRGTAVPQGCPSRHARGARTSGGAGRSGGGDGEHHSRVAARTI